MLLVLSILLVVLGIGILLFSEWCDELQSSDRGDKEKKNLSHVIKKFLYYNSNAIRAVGGFVTLVGGVALAIMLVILPLCHMGVDGYVEKNKERYEALTYKVESGACRDEFGLLSKEVIDEIQEWNEEVVKGKAMQNDLWLGIFNPDIYDQFETIDYEKYMK